MQKKLLQRKDDLKIEYVSPKINIVSLKTDIITESHFDPNAGEWDPNQ